ncbi:MAG: hypothetical protein JWM04_1588 [Verrucomicrobiales bacterium]|nr:hypothetical protein [Verrucomicrobiales bacterium]
MNSIKDLTKESPRSPRMKVGGYVLLARMADKGRAFLQSKNGEYHFDCPLDNMLFGFKGVKGEEVKKVLQSGASDQEIANWFDTHGTPKSPQEVEQWGKSVEAARPYDNPEKRDWFVGECSKLGLDPSKVTLFDMLEADDLATFA